MRHTHAHSHRVAHPHASGSTLTAVHTHPHNHSADHDDRSLAPHAMHKHDARKDPHAQARREWDAAANARGIKS